MPECEAERRIKMALHQMELDWGSGRFDYATIRGILDPRDTPKCSAPLVTSSKLVV